MNAPFTAAEAWCWAAHLLGTEALDLQYRWPEADHDGAAQLQLEADAFYARAQSLDPDEGLWQRAMAKWDGQPVRSTGEP